MRRGRRDEMKHADDEAEHARALQAIPPPPNANNAYTRSNNNDNNDNAYLHTTRCHLTPLPLLSPRITTKPGRMTDSKYPRG